MPSLLWCVWQMATASASAAWSGWGMRSRQRMVLVISCTWILLARPYPVTAILIWSGEYSQGAASTSEAARMSTPLA